MINTKDYEKFTDLLNLLKQRGSLCYQVYGFTNAEVCKFWRKAKKEYNLPRAKTIKNETITLAGY